MTEQQSAVPDCTPVDAQPATPPSAPSTRRQLRVAQEAREAAAAAATPPAEEPAVERVPAAPFADVRPVWTPTSEHAIPAQVPDERAHPAAVAPAETVDTPISRRSLRANATGTGHGRRRSAPHPTPSTAQRVGRTVTTLALVGTLAVSGFTFQREAAAGSAAAGLTGAQIQIARSDAATTARLTAEATAFADGRHAAALEAAQTALAQTDTVVQTAATVLDAAALTSLQEAADELEALLEAGGGTVLSTAGVEITAVESDGAVATPDPQDALRDAAASRASRSDSTGRAPLAELSEPDLGQQDSAAGVDQAPPDTTVEEGVEAEEGVGTDEQDGSEHRVDLAASARLLELAAQVTALSTEVQTTLDAKVADEEARALAAAAAAAAAAEMARKVEIAKDSPNGEIPTSVLCAPSFAPQELVRCDAAEALEHLNTAYRAEFGQDLEIVSSYRSYGEQIATRRSRGWLAAVPGSSNHGLALAVDFGSFGSLGNFSHPSYRWMKANAGDYGWFHPSLMERGGGGPQEPWHWEFGTS